MRILLLNPPYKTEYGRYSRSSRSPAITKSGTIYYPIWLCYAAGALEEAGHEIRVIDSCAYGYGLGETLRLAEGFGPDITVIDTSTPSILSDLETGARIKGVLPATLVVIMGTHPSALPEETLALEEAVDAAVVGEADHTLMELAEKVSKAGPSVMKDEEARKELLGLIDGLAFRAGGRVFVNRRRPLIENLDELPFVSKVYGRHLDARRYFFAASDYPEVQIMTARGCVARCSYCVYPQTMHGWKYRARSAENIVREFIWIKENMREIRQVGIEDDTFAGDQKRVVEFCGKLIESGVRMKWYCNVRVDLRYETMLWMKKAGCALVTVGYESASRDVLERIGKKATPEMITEFSRNTKKAGLLAHGCFMAGNRGDTRETLQESLDLAMGLLDDTMQFFPLIVYPGTKDYDLAAKEGLLTVNDYSEYLTGDGNHKSVSRTPEMTSEELTQWCDHARRKYYLRPRYIAYKLMQQIKRPSEARRTFRAAARFMKFLARGQRPDRGMKGGRP